MIPLNSWQRLSPKAIWFGLVRSLCVAMVLIAIGGLSQRYGNSGVVPGLLYLYSVFLVSRSVLYVKTYTFFLTDTTLTTVAGYLYRNSCSFRFDRIQDVDTTRGPIHALFGLKTVAIWTASPDQSGGKRRGPDARLVLDAESADWLRDYLVDPPASTVVPSSALPKTAPSANAGFVSIVCLGVAMAVPLVMLVKNVKVIRPDAIAAPAIVAAPATATPPAQATPSLHLEQAPATAQPAPLATTVVPDDYAIACSIHGSGRIDDVIPCAKFGESHRCQRETDFPSKPTPQPAMLTVVNRSDQGIKFYWLDPHGRRSLYASLPPGGHVNQESHLGAHWLVSTGDDRCIAIVDASTMTIGFF
jgi:membrane protein YdbS with pleckstrin-like domain